VNAELDAAADAREILNELLQRDPLELPVAQVGDTGLIGADPKGGVDLRPSLERVDNRALKLLFEGRDGVWSPADHPMAAIISKR